MSVRLRYQHNKSFPIQRELQAAAYTTIIG